MYRSARTAATTAAALFIAVFFGPAHAQDQPEIPGAVESMPTWLKGDAPFDVAEFFAMVPPDRNAAPLYLDALLDFTTDVAICFPDGPEKERRVAATKRLNDRFLPMYEAFSKDPNSVPDAAIDALLKGYEPGFRKLAEAQERPECVFATGLDFAALLPHAQAARQVVRVAEMKAHRDLEKGEIDAAIGDVALCLRASRDLRPRGSAITELVSVAMDSLVYRHIVAPILAAPALSPERCDRIVRLLGQQGRALDPYEEGLKGEYLVTRGTLRTLMGRADDLDPEEQDRGRSVMLNLWLAQSGKDPSEPAAQQAKERFLREFKEVQPAEYDRAISMLDAGFRTLLDHADRPYVERKAEEDRAFDPIKDDPTLGPLIGSLLPDVGFFDESTTRIEAELRATACLALLRRYQLTHNGKLPPDLLTAARDGGLPAVPVDPYSGEPLKMTTDRRGGAVVYSVGADGKDDRGRVDSDFNRKPGDLLFPLPDPVK